MLELEKNKKGFTLIEIIVTLGFLALIAAMLLPSINNLMTASKKEKEASKIIYALESAIENEKSKDMEDKEYGHSIKNYNGYEIDIIRSYYGENLDKIEVKYKNYKLDLIEVVNEEKWIYSN